MAETDIKVFFLNLERPRVFVVKIARLYLHFDYFILFFFGGRPVPDANEAGDSLWRRLAHFSKLCIHQKEAKSPK